MGSTILYNFALWYAKDDTFVESLKLAEDNNYFDFYTWGGLKYFLMCYEASLKENKTVKIGQILNSRSSGKTGDYFSVEHIWATKHEESVYNTIKDSHVRRRLGNFMLLELNLNIAGSNHGIQRKIALYSGATAVAINDAENPKQPSEMAQCREMLRDAKSALKEFDINIFEDKRFRPYRDLHKTICDRREVRFARFARSQWSISEYLGYNETLAQIARESGKDEMVE